ncbi:MAG: hypothetical protein EOP58_12160 [Sphingomonadales bacterium]|nr:MAG: hypothetical protein EOP58_12160 [Sphingomonadales bacterium]
MSFVNVRPGSSPPAPAQWIVAIVVLVAAAQAWALWPFFTPDIGIDYVPWFNYAVTHGGWRAFATPFGSYSPPYLYLLALAAPLKGVLSDAHVIKVVAFVGMAWLVGSIWQLLRALKTPHAWRYALCVPALPSVMLNAGLLGQVDALYVAPCIMAVAAALERRHITMFAWCGVAVAFKAQAVLIAPFFLAIAIQRRIPLAQWLAAPAALLGMMVPALLAGWPPADLATIYFRQAGTFSNDIARNAPNIWSLAGMIAPDFAPRLFGLALATALGATAWFVARMQVVRFDKAGLVGMAALAALLTAGLLPRMHERYFMLADMLIIAFAIARGTRPAFALAALVQIGSFAAITGYLGLGPPVVALGALCMIAATLIVARPLAIPNANDNPPTGRNPRPAILWP